MDRIAQSASEPFERNLHYISVLKGDSGAKTQAVRSKKVDVNVTRPPVRFKLEVMMIKVLQTVAHFRFPGSERSGPD